MYSILQNFKYLKQKLHIKDYNANIVLIKVALIQSIIYTITINHYIYILNHTHNIYTT